MYCNNGIDYLKLLKVKEIFIFGAGIQGRRCAHKLLSGGGITLSDILITIRKSKDSR